MRTEKIWQLPSVPAETGRIPEARERKGKNPQPEKHKAPDKVLNPPSPALEAPVPTAEESENEEQKLHLDTLA